MVPAATQQPLSGVEAVVHLQPIDDFVEGKASFQVAPANEVLGIAAEMAVAVHEARINRMSLSINDFRGAIVAHDVIFITDCNELTVLHGEGLSHREISIDGIDFGIVDDKVHRRFMGTRGHD